MPRKKSTTSPKTPVRRAGANGGQLLTGGVHGHKGTGRTPYPAEVRSLARESINPYMVKRIAKIASGAAPDRKRKDNPDPVKPSVNEQLRAFQILLQVGLTTSGKVVFNDEDFVKELLRVGLSFVPVASHAHFIAAIQKAVEHRVEVGNLDEMLGGQVVVEEDA